jgi:chondroitin AC lyase
MSYGTHTCLARRGDEYHDISAVWDFAHIPGTTARIENDEQIHSHRYWWCLPLPNSHAGGLTSGDFGILYEKPEHDGISALVSFFTFDGCLVSLGADIRDEHPERGPLTTTVDQCWAKDTKIDRSLHPRHVSNGEWTYFNLDDETNFEIEVGEKIGSWRRNNHSVPDAPVKGDLFMVCIPTEPTHPQFAYMAAPADREGGTVQILRNDAACQAIVVGDQKKTLMAVFHEQGSLIAPDGTELAGKCGHCLILPL